MANHAIDRGRIPQVAPSQGPAAHLGRLRRLRLLLLGETCATLKFVSASNKTPSSVLFARLGKSEANSPPPPPPPRASPGSGPHSARCVPATCLAGGRHRRRHRRRPLDALGRIWQGGCSLVGQHQSIASTGRTKGPAPRRMEDRGGALGGGRRSCLKVVASGRLFIVASATSFNYEERPPLPSGPTNWPPSDATLKFRSGLELSGNKEKPLPHELPLPVVNDNGAVPKTAAENHREHSCSNHFPPNSKSGRLETRIGAS